MAIKRVWIIEGCISSGLCENLCPDVFKLEGTAVVIEGADFEEYEDMIKQAAENCPVEVIKYE
jgi:ferredoxin